MPELELKLPLPGKTKEDKFSKENVVKIRSTTEHGDWTILTLVSSSLTFLSASSSVLAFSAAACEMFEDE